MEKAKWTMEEHLTIAQIQYMCDLPKWWSRRFRLIYVGDDSKRIRTLRTKPVAFCILAIEKILDAFVKFLKQLRMVKDASILNFKCSTFLPAFRGFETVKLGVKDFEVPLENNHTIRFIDSVCNKVEKLPKDLHRSDTEPSHVTAVITDNLCEEESMNNLKVTRICGWKSLLFIKMEEHLKFLSLIDV
uniref:Uncharacterized protein n=1 Tax=Romanomermis culicivorax TaxID=13658 RepID=A0A915I1A7_ROMCU